MPKISQAYSTVKLTLPSYKDSVVKLKNNIPVADLIESEKIEENFEKAVFLVSKMIVEWNFQDEEGKELPIKPETLKQFPSSDIQFLMEKITPFIKKKA